MLSDGNITAHSDGDKAEMLCDFFSKCFNHAVPPLSPGNSTLNTGHTIPEELLCTEDEVHFFLTSLDTSKATGPDGSANPQEVFSYHAKPLQTYLITKHCE